MGVQDTHKTCAHITRSLSTRTKGFSPHLGPGPDVQFGGDCLNQKQCSGFTCLCNKTLSHALWKCQKGAGVIWVTLRECSVGYPDLWLYSLRECNDVGYPDPLLTRAEKVCKEATPISAEKVSAPALPHSPFFSVTCLSHLSEAILLAHFIKAVLIRQNCLQLSQLTPHTSSTHIIHTHTSYTHTIHTEKSGRFTDLRQCATDQGFTRHLERFHGLMHSLVALWLNTREKRDQKMGETWEQHSQLEARTPYSGLQMLTRKKKVSDLLEKKKDVGELSVH